jgi:hypothetical protein
MLVTEALDRSRCQTAYAALEDGRLVLACRGGGVVWLYVLHPGAPGYTASGALDVALEEPAIPRLGTAWHPSSPR